MLAIIDCDSIVYSSAGAAQHRNEQGEMEYESVVNAYSNAKHMMLKILEKTGCNDYRAFLTATDDSTSFRKLMYPEYKANRKGERPKYYPEVREYLIQNWDAEVVGEIEADDAVCMVQHDCYKNGFSTDEETLKNYIDVLINAGDFNDEAVLCGIDKDLNQIPGLHYNYKKDIFYYITPLQGLKNLYLQMLTGDTADNIPRIKKGWRQKQAEEEIMASSDEFTLYSFVFHYICKDKFGYGDYGILSKEQEKKINDEILWRGKLLYLKKHDKDEYKLPIED